MRRIDRQTSQLIEKQIKTQIDILMHGLTERQGDKQIDIQADRQKGRQKDIYIQLDRQDRKTKRETGNQPARKTDTYVHRQTENTYPAVIVASAALRDLHHGFEPVGSQHSADWVKLQVIEVQPQVLDASFKVAAEC